MILLDTGPFVALFDPADRDHQACHRVLASVTEPLYTTEAVLTEVFHLLAAGSRGAEGVREFILQGYVAPTPLSGDALQRCFELMERYADLPMDFADATLLAVAEQFKTDKVFTLDFSDFGMYRVKKGHRYYPLLLVGREVLE